MEFITTTAEEEGVCLNSAIGKRDNSKKIDYHNKVNEKPWGKEYLAYQNTRIGIWILHINRDQETSLHCHFKKDTILIPLFGCFKINLFNSYRILNLFDCLYVPLNTFHGLHSYTDNGIIMEIEIYTEKVTYTDKNDLLRIKDIYNRDKNTYESSVTERDSKQDESMNFNCPNNYDINNTKVSILKVSNLSEIKNKYDKVVLLDGVVYSDGKRITSGSFINLNEEPSLLTECIEVLCLGNLDYKYLKKVIYSKSHLTDYLALNNLTNIGLTSGCFDILHEGHVKNLKTCKINCTSLLVCLSSDNQIKRLKGEKRPINNLADRINMLIHFDFIDLLILYDEINDALESELDNLINIINPSVWFKGTDYTRDDIFKKHPSLKKIQLINFVEGKSTTNIIKKINT
jgi:D-beta-D-heptose 7-phosphate kinase/D-beta-D-heptose 1-phosphate adenosyltransferase